MPREVGAPPPAAEREPPGRREGGAQVGRRDKRSPDTSRVSREPLIPKTREQNRRRGPGAGRGAQRTPAPLSSRGRCARRRRVLPAGLGLAGTPRALTMRGARRPPRTEGHAPGTPGSRGRGRARDGRAATVGKQTRSMGFSCSSSCRARAPLTVGPRDPGAGGEEGVGSAGPDHEPGRGRADPPARVDSGGSRFRMGFEPGRGPDCGAVASSARPARPRQGGAGRGSAVPRRAEARPPAPHAQAAVLPEEGPRVRGEAAGPRHRSWGRWLREGQGSAVPTKKPSPPSESPEPGPCASAAGAGRAAPADAPAGTRRGDQARGPRGAREERKVAPRPRGCRATGRFVSFREPVSGAAGPLGGVGGSAPGPRPPSRLPPLRAPAAPSPAPPRPRCPPRPPAPRARRGRRAAQAGPRRARLRGRGGCPRGSPAHPALWARPDFSLAAFYASSAGSGTTFSPDFREKNRKPVIFPDPRRPA